jgi:hypothetical protein
MTQLCPAGERELARWRANYNNATNGNWQFLFFSPWKHIENCDQCKQAMRDRQAERFGHARDDAADLAAFARGR